MRVERADRQDKGWYLGLWNSNLPISIGYANTGIDEPHLHTAITEIYLVASGTSNIRIEDQTIALSPGDIVVVDPGEAHTFLDSSPDYFHFVLHVPGITGETARTEKEYVSRKRLALD